MDLFGKEKIKRKTKIQSRLESLDSNTLNDRIERSKYLAKIIPPHISFICSPEMHYLLNEAIHCFINGQFVATLLLSQSFIEHWLEGRIDKKELRKYGKSSLDSRLKAMKDKNTIHLSLLNKIDRLRKIRNPFVHFKNSDYEFNLMNLAFSEKIKPDDYFFKEAKDAISLVYQICITKII